MSGGHTALQPTNDDLSKLLMAKVHLGTKNCGHQMEKYVHARRQDGVHILNLHKTWEKLLLAARIIAAVPNAADVCAISNPQYGQRAILKFCKFTGATPLAGRFVPGTFTNQIQAAFREPRVLVVTDPRVDHQPVREASYVNIPIIAFCNTDTPMRHIDVAIPCNNKGEHAVGLLWWMLAREVQRIRGELSRDMPWDEVMPDLFFFRKPEDVEAQEAAAEDNAAATDAAPSTWEAAPAEGGAGMSATAPTLGGDWNAAADVANIAIQPIGTNAFSTAGLGAGDEWGAAGADWSSSAPTEWGASA